MTNDESIRKVTTSEMLGELNEDGYHPNRLEDEEAERRKSEVEETVKKLAAKKRKKEIEKEERAREEPNAEPSLTQPAPGEENVPLEQKKLLSKEEVTQLIQKQFRREHQQPEEEISKEEQERRTKARQKIIIVTGGAGFMGSHLIKTLNDQGREDILLVDDLTDPRKLQNINTLKFQDYADKSKFIELLGFLAENDMVERIYHLGAESSRQCKDGKYLMENNYQYTCNIMDICHMHHIPLVFASSASVYGQSEIQDDTSDDYTPESYYALSKLQADRYSRKFMEIAEDRIIGLRYFNVNSDGKHEQHKDDMKSALCWMTEQYEKDGVIKLFKGSKEFSRDFITVETAIWMTMNAMQKGRSGIYNIGQEKARTFYNLASDILEKDFNVDESCIKYVPMPENIAEGYQKFTEANMVNACFGTTTRP